jgi:hypothetical protein
MTLLLSTSAITRLRCCPVELLPDFAAWLDFCTTFLLRDFSAAYLRGCMAPRLQTSCAVLCLHCAAALVLLRYCMIPLLHGSTFAQLF